MKPDSRTLEDLFAAALEIADPSERQRWLDDQCGSDTPLRSRLNSLLASYERAGDFLQRPAVEELSGDNELVSAVGSSGDSSVEHRSVPASDGLQSKAESPFLSPQLTSLGALAEYAALLQPARRSGGVGRLGEYELVELIGVGGTGGVFRAWDERLQRSVAVKILAPHLSTQTEGRDRFLREARAAAAVAHENVVTIYSVEEYRSVPYIVMQYVSGGSLHERLQEGPLSWPDIVSISRQLASGLAAAHQKGLIHRDIKPANVLMDGRLVKITDFGLARAVDDARLTRPGKVAGTPHYMSPEQAQDEPIDHRSDLFSLGCVLYAMCVGESPFFASGTLAALRAVCDRPHRPLTEVAPHVPAWMGELVDRLLQKNPAQRPDTAQQVADIVHAHWLDLLRGDSSSLGSTVSVVPYTQPISHAHVTPVSVPTLRRRRTWRSWLGTGGVVVVLAAAGFYGQQAWQRSSRELSASSSQDLVEKTREAEARGEIANPRLPESADFRQSSELALSPAWEWADAENLGAAINSVMDEGQPHLSADGLTLIFNSSRDGGFGGQDLWQCQRATEDSAWETPVNLGPTINTADEEVDPCLSSDGKTLVYATERPGGVGDFDVWIAHRSSTRDPWLAPRPLSDAVNSPDLDGGPCLSTDGLTLWFHSYRSESAGSDLWYSQRATLESEFRPAVNAGPTINLENGEGSWGESSCALSADERLLIWTQCISQSPPRFRLMRASRTSVAEPFSNVGPLDTSLQATSNVSPMLSADGKTLFFTTWRPGGVGNADLWVTRRVPIDRPAIDAKQKAIDGNYALRLDGASSHVIMKSLVRTDPGPGTIEAWVRPDENQSPRALVVWGGPARCQLSIGAEEWFVWDESLERSSVNAVRTPEPGEPKWVHLAYVIDANEGRLYVDGELQSRAPRTGQLLNNASRVAHGWLAGHAEVQPGPVHYHFRGSLDEVRVSTVARYHDNFTPPHHWSSDADTAALYHFDEGAGSTLMDSSAHDHHGRIYGATWEPAER